MVKSSFSRVTLVGACLTSVLLLAGCGAGPTSSSQSKTAAGDTAWKFDKTIPTPVTVTGGATADVKLGDLAANKVSVDIPKGALDADAAISLANPDDAPKYVGAEMTPLTAPIEITAGDKPVRLNAPATVTFNFDKSALPPNTDPFKLRVSYYNGTTWEILQPTTLDMDKGQATFETYHFSGFALNQIKDDTKLTEDYIHSKSLDKLLKKNFNKTSDHVAEQIIDLTLQQMGVSDQSLKGKVLADVLKDDSYKDLYDAYQSGDMVDASQKMALLAGSKMAEIVPASVYQAGLKKIVGSADQIATVSQAAGLVAGGDYKGAAKLIGTSIANKALITTAVTITAQVVQGQIDSWQNSEVEAAYKAYRDGANGHFWGYNNDAKDFDSVWDQMRGIRRQLEINAIKKENSVRSDNDLPPLTPDQENVVRDETKESFRGQFTSRAAGEAALKQEEDKENKILAAFKNDGFFDPAGAPGNFGKGLDEQGVLNLMYGFADKVMKDTNRPDLTDKTGLIVNGAINTDDIVRAARYFFSGPDGKQQYAKFLKDRFGINLSPALANLAGAWQNGQIVITDIYISDALKQQMAAAKAQGTAADKDNPLSGCDLAITPADLAAMKGKSAPFAFSLAPQGDAGGTLSITAKGSPSQSFPFTYDGGTIKATTSQKGANVTFTINVSEGAKEYDAAGPVTVDFSNGGVKIAAQVTGTHPLPATKK